MQAGIDFPPNPRIRGKSHRHFKEGFDVQIWLQIKSLYFGISDRQRTALRLTILLAGRPTLYHKQTVGTRHYVCTLRSSTGRAG